ncbi:MAG: PAS domain S-box protein [Anaerolineales bacterium]|nr:PAS domain S-box protein [Anaerolineales bacterium]MCZ2123570.1 PAS domain S-box protein [Anaerolineales bacterium]
MSFKPQTKKNNSFVTIVFQSNVQQVAKLFNWVLGLIAAALIISIPVINARQNEFILAVIIFSLAALIVPFYLVYWQAFEAAAIFISVFFITVVTVISTSAQGIHHIAVIVLPAIIMIAGLTARKRNLILIVLYALACIAWLVFGEMYQWHTPEAAQGSRYSDFLIVGLISVLTAALARTMIEAIYKNYRLLQNELKERKLAEESYRNLFENAIDGVFRSSPAGKILKANPALAAMHGYDSPEDMIHSVTNIATQVYANPERREFLKQELLAGKIIKDYEILKYRKDGSTFWTSVNAKAIYNSDGELLCFEGSEEDITPRKKAEDRKTYLQALFSQSLDGFFFCIFDEPQEWDATADNEAMLDYIYNTQRFTDVNDALLEQYGISREKFLNCTSNYFFQHDPEQGKALRQALFDQGRVFVETNERREDGSPICVEGEYACLYDEQNRIVGFFGIQRDITNRKRVEKALQRSEKRFRSAFQASPIAIFIATLAEGRLLDANQAYWNMTGYSAEMALGKTVEELKFRMKPLDRPKFIEALKQKQSLSNVEEMLLYYPDGSYKPVIAFYELIQLEDQDCVLAMFYDVSAQKKLEAERKNLISQLELRNHESETLRKALAYLVETFEFDEIIQRTLDEIQKVIPYDSASVWSVEKDTQKLIAHRHLPPEHVASHPEWPLDETNSAYPVIVGKVPYFLENDVQAHLSDFSEYPDNLINSWLAIPLKARGKILGLIALDGYALDQFTEHHAELAVNFANQVAVALENAHLFSELQAELETRQELISELETKNSELERFTYTVSHDLKSPLVTINGFLGYLEADILSGKVERVQRDRKRIQEAVDKMYHLLNDLLELSRIGRIVAPSETLEFSELVEEALNIVHGRLDKNKVAVQIQPNLPAIYGDRQRLIEVLQNLLDNAAKFMGQQPNPKIEIGQAGMVNDLPIFFVKDNGIGIAKQYHEQVFGLFNKLDAKGDSTGIGLALVKRIVEVHGGQIWLESEVGQGTTFFFTLPTPPK